MRSKYSITLLLPSLFLLLFFTCIERNNIWDPINGCPEQYRKEIQDSSLHQFQNFSIDAASGLEQLYEQTPKIDSLNKLNDSIHSIFKSMENRLDSIYMLNSSIDSLNRIDCRILKNKSKVDTFPSLTFFTDTVEVKDYRDLIRTNMELTLSRISTDNNECTPQGIHSKEFQDSVKDFYVRLTTSADSLVNHIKEFNSNISDTNTIITTMKNRDIVRYNEMVESYNDSIRLAMEYCKSKWLSDPDEIKKLIDSIQPGDTISIDSGTHTLTLKFLEKGSSERPIIIQGSPFNTTKLLYPSFSISKSQNIIIRNIAFIKSTTRGLNIENNSSDIWLKHCHFIDSKDNGLDVLNSIVTVDNCEFTGNEHGVYCNGPDAKLELKNVLIVRNRGYGILCNNSELNISKATISDNQNSGIQIKDQRSSLSIVSTLLTYNGAYGLERTLNGNINEISLYLSLFFGNAKGDFTGDTAKIKIDVSCKNGDPQYANREMNDYKILNSEFSILGYTP